MQMHNITETREVASDISLPQGLYNAPIARSLILRLARSELSLCNGHFYSCCVSPSTRDTLLN